MINSKNTKITTIILATILIFAIIAVGIYFLPYYKNKREAQLISKIKKSNSIFTTKILEEFNKDKNIKASNAARKVAAELNAVSKNLFNKDEQAYLFDTTCTLCNSVDYNDDLSMVVLTVYDKNGELLSRTVIKPPSFVTYVKGDE